MLLWTRNEDPSGVEHSASLQLLPSLVWQKCTQLHASQVTRFLVLLIILSLHKGCAQGSQYRFASSCLKYHLAEDPCCAHGNTSLAWLKCVQDIAQPSDLNWHAGALWRRSCPCTVAAASPEIVRCLPPPLAMAPGLTMSWPPLCTSQVCYHFASFLLLLAHCIYIRFLRGAHTGLCSKV